MEEVETEGEATGPGEEAGMEEAVRTEEGSEEDWATEAQAEVALEEALGWGETGRVAAEDWGWAMAVAAVAAAVAEEAAQAEAGLVAGGSE